MRKINRITPAQIEKATGLSKGVIISLVKSGDVPDDLYFKERDRVYFNNMDESIDFFSSIDNDEDFDYDMDYLDRNSDIEKKMKIEQLKQMEIRNKKESGAFMDKDDGLETLKNIADIIMERLIKMPKKVSVMVGNPKMEKEVYDFIYNEINLIRSDIQAKVEKF